MTVVDGPSEKKKTPRRSWLDLAAFLVSAATSPFLVMAVTAAVVVYALGPTWQQFLLWAAVAAFTTAFIPFGVVFLLWRTGRVTDMHVAVREQRGIPFAAAIVSASVGLVILRLLAAPAELVGLAAAFLVNGAALALITRSWKISIHAAAYTGCVLGLAMVASPSWLVALAALPFVFWARLHRGRHTLSQGIVPVVLVSALTPAAYFVTNAILGG